ncbi:hypothetical protein MHB46_02545 [Paenibacillus sp. FSL H7-0703]|uniref:hypothetical protein n=1 Tax=Paenibacillus sp. FSL H7-0703 TaxID=2921438 RepID=UPI0030F6D15D
MQKHEREQLLVDLYEHQISQGHINGGGLKKDNSNPEDYITKRAIVKFWEEQGVIEKTAEAIGFINFKLTAYGIEYVEQNLK